MAVLILYDFIKTDVAGNYLRFVILSLPSSPVPLEKELIWLRARGNRNKLLKPGLSHRQLK
jgi:hypothetical protein